MSWEKGWRRTSEILRTERRFWSEKRMHNPAYTSWTPRPETRETWPPGYRPAAGPPTPASTGDAWEGPTLRELAERVEHQFGQAPALAGIYTLGFGRDEALTPCDVLRVCDLLGLPAEDFGVDA
jgi:hypothetical protein